eukprot:CAMPEP_0174705882 /NCGR_PEP_ID=MMETSP1094-20130205/8942_1 /TAXON_ID=156173 /ORGANISM="Chrysochromulina brevifilum, Strain UTEX LB 985" /LENGTH=127 /DNA_ID=CAMNT_0015904095 /DNA_START=234 /DNA_END=613 /DNA_ORIENTATION=+
MRRRACCFPPNVRNEQTGATAVKQLEGVTVTEFNQLQRVVALPSRCSAWWLMKILILMRSEGICIPRVTEMSLRAAGIPPYPTAWCVPHPNLAHGTCSDSWNHWCPGKVEASYPHHLYPRVVRQTCG